MVGVGVYVGRGKATGEGVGGRWGTGEGKVGGLCG